MLHVLAVALRTFDFFVLMLLDGEDFAEGQVAFFTDVFGL